MATRAGHLKIHIETKHFGMNYACSECQYSAATTGNLKRHVQSMHEDILVPNVIMLQLQHGI